MTEKRSHTWAPITDLPTNTNDLGLTSVQNLLSVWVEKAKELQNKQSYESFHERLRRQWAIETGIIERLYSISESGTKTLIEKGLDAAFLAHDDTDRDPELVVAMLKDQLDTIEGLYQFVSGQRKLSISYIREMHQVMTAHQSLCDARDLFGRLVRVPLERGTWKKLPNNIEFDDGTRFEFCPPEQVDSQMEQLMFWHVRHEAQGVSPEIEAAWLHHRFVLIHPFQDGNGRIARCLASLVLMRARWFPMVVTRTDKPRYIEALRCADRGELTPLIELVGELQRQAVLDAMNLAEIVLSEDGSLESEIQSIRDITAKRKSQRLSAQKAILLLADQLVDTLDQKLIGVRDKLAHLVKELDPEYRVFKALAHHKDSEAAYNRFQAVNCAKQLGYFANMEYYRAWAKLVLVTSTTTEILFSFHGVGHESDGIIACAPMFYEKALIDQELAGALEKRIGYIRPLSKEPFLLTYRDDFAELSHRFHSWINERITEAIRLWKQGL